MISTTMRRPGDAYASSFETLYERMLASRDESPAPTSVVNGQNAPINLWETDSAYHAALLLPGLSADSIEVTVEDGQVAVAAERKSLAVEGARTLWADFGPAVFRRTFRVSATVDASKMEATYQDGVLRLVLPKSPEAQPRRIAVKIPGTGAS